MDRSEEIMMESAILRKADRDIEEGRTRLLHQQRLVFYLQDLGHQTREAERLVELMEQTLHEWQRHRTLIVQRLAYLKNEPIPPVVTDDDGPAA